MDGSANESRGEFASAMQATVDRAVGREDVLDARSSIRLDGGMVIVLVVKSALFVVAHGLSSLQFPDSPFVGDNGLSRRIDQEPPDMFGTCVSKSVSANRSRDDSKLGGSNAV